MKHARRTPEFITFDATCKTNKWNHAYVMLLGIDSSWKNTVFAHCYLAHENTKSFSFVWTVAMPLLYGMSTMSAITAVMSDGDPQAIKAVDDAISYKFIGDGHAVRKRCFFHAFSQTFLEVYAARRTKDGGIGELVRKRARYLIFYEEKPVEFEMKWLSLIKWLTHRTAGGCFKE